MIRTDGLLGLITASCHSRLRYNVTAGRGRKFESTFRTETVKTSSKVNAFVTNRLFYFEPYFNVIRMLFLDRNAIGMLNEQCMSLNYLDKSYSIYRTVRFCCYFFTMPIFGNVVATNI